MPRKERPLPYIPPETVIRGGVGAGGGGASNTKVRGEGGVSTFPVVNSATKRTPILKSRPSALPGDVIQKVQMKIGTEVKPSSETSPTIRDNGSLIGRGSTLLSSTNSNQFSSIPR